tara:strand:+ start:10402 stop:10641 length:240 start_codon:yes stop_codon:yes gene_type:complete
MLNEKTAIFTDHAFLINGQPIILGVVLEPKIYFEEKRVEHSVREFRAYRYVNERFRFAFKLPIEQGIELFDKKTGFVVN